MFRMAQPEINPCSQQVAALHCFQSTRLPGIYNKPDTECFTCEFLLRANIISPSNSNNLHLILTHLVRVFWDLQVQLSSSLWSEQSRKPSHLSLSSTQASPSEQRVPLMHNRGPRVAEQRQKGFTLPASKCATFSCM